MNAQRKKLDEKNSERKKTRNHEFLELGGTAVPGLLLKYIYKSNEFISSFCYANRKSLFAYSTVKMVWIREDGIRPAKLIYQAANQVRCMAWSPNDGILGIADDNEIVLFDVEGRTIIKRLFGHQSWVNDLIFLSPTYLLSAGADATVSLWAIHGDERRILFQCNEIITSLVLNEEKKVVVAVSATGEVVHFDLELNVEIERFYFEQNNKATIALAQTTGLLATAIDANILIETSLDGTKGVLELNAHSDMISGISFSPDGKLLASKSWDGSVKFWDTNSWQCIGSISETSGRTMPSNICFSPDGKYLVTKAVYDTAIRIWEIDTRQLINNAPLEESIRYTTAKIVLVGDSGVGKTGLGWRISQGTFKEHESTHGQQFWVAEDLGTLREDGTECEAVLWDLAGQPDYRLVHSLFLDKVDLALVLFDPTIRDNQLSSVGFWVNQLQVNREKPCPMILVGSRVDRGTSTLTNAELCDFANSKGFIGGYLPTSAASDEGIQNLKETIKSIIPWDTFSTTITTVTFKIIKEFILALKENNEKTKAIVTHGVLGQMIADEHPELHFGKEDLHAAVKHLENHGYVTVIQNSRQEIFILLFPDLIINLASSMILEARKNPRGLGVLEEKSLLEGNYIFKELEVLNSQERKIMIDATISLFLKNAICFRESLSNENFFVFPSLINEKKPMITTEEITEGASYVVSGSIENVYPSLVVLLGYTNTFTRQNQWQNQAEYQLSDRQVCGFRQRSEKEGEVEFILYHINDVSSHNKQFFQSLFEKFLIRKDIAVKRYLPVICSVCREQVQRSVVMERLSKVKDFTFCHECGNNIFLGDAVETLQVKQFDPKIDSQKKIAIRRTTFSTLLVKLKNLIEPKYINKPPRCFVCYAWGNKEHEAWVERFARDLKNAGIDVLLDKWSNPLGSSISQYLDEIEAADFVIPVGTKMLKNKYMARDLESVVESELRLINTRLRRHNTHGHTVFPVLLEGKQSEAFTPQLQDVVYANFIDEEDYFINLMDFIGQIYSLRGNNDFIEMSRHLNAAVVFA